MTDNRSGGLRQSLHDSGRALVVALKGLYELAPGVVLVGAILAFWLVWLTMKWAPLMTGTAVLLILSLSLTLYAVRGNFGEALLSLVGGLLSIFAYSWTVERYVAFSVAWVGFALAATLIASVKIASQVEEIYKQASLRILGPSFTNDQLKETDRTLRGITSQNSGTPMLGPVERATVIRTFAFRGLPKSLFKAALRATELLSVITKCDTQRITLFVADFFLSLHPSDDAEAMLVTDVLNRFVQNTPVPPEEFFAAFEKSRRLILAKVIEPNELLEELQFCLTQGIPPTEVCNEIQSRHGSTGTSLAAVPLSSTSAHDGATKVQ